MSSAHEVALFYCITMNILILLLQATSRSLEFQPPVLIVSVGEGELIIIRQCTCVCGLYKSAMNIVNDFDITRPFLLQGVHKLKEL